MDYIDWIISSVVFITVIALVLISLFNILPKSNTNNDLFSDALYKSVISQTIPVYNLSINNESNDVYAYSLDLDSTVGFSQNIGFKDENKYYGVLQKKDLYFYYDLNPGRPFGVFIFNENFNDFNYLDSFVLSPDTNINTGILELKEPTTITTNSEFYDFFGFLTTTDSLNIYISYTDVNNNYFCRFEDSSISIGKTENSTQTILKTTSYSKITDWHRVYFGYTRDNLIVCNADETESSYLDSNIIPKTNIVVSTIYNYTLIDDFYIYLNNDISSDSNASRVTGNYFDTNISDNLATITVTDAGFSSILDLNFDKNLIVPDTNGITLIKNESEDNKLGIFPQSKEFWVFKDSNENIEITLDENTGLDFNISPIDSLSLWLDASTLDLEDGALVSSWTDKSGNGNHAAQNNNGNKPIFKTNILNGKPVVRFDGTDDFFEHGDVLDMGLNDLTIYLVLASTNTSDSMWILTKSKAAAQNYRYAVGVGYGHSRAFMQGNGGADVIPEGTKQVCDGFAHLLGYEYKRNANLSLFVDGEFDTSATISQWVAKDMQSNNPFRTGVYTNSNNIGITGPYNGDLAEILIYNSALSDSNRLLVENYLFQKYGIDDENGLDTNGTSIEFIDFNFSNKKILLEFLDNKTMAPIGCNYTYKNKKLTIKDCSSDVLIKIRYRFEELENINLESPKLNITKTNERIVTQEQFDNLSCDSYFVNIKNKTLDANCNIGVNPTYKNTTKFLYNTGLLETASIYIK